MRHIAVVESNDLDFAQYDRCIASVFEALGDEYTITRFNDGSEITAKYTPKYNAIIMSIELPYMDGLEAAREIRQRGDDTPIIFVSAMTCFAHSAYNVRAFDYISKPVNSARLVNSIRLALDRRTSDSDQKIVFRDKSDLLALRPSEIYYVELVDGRSHFHTKYGEQIIRCSLKQAEEQLGPGRFIRRGRNRLINPDYQNVQVGRAD